MTCDTDHLTATTVPPQDTTICVALELSRSKWLVGVNLPGSDKISKHTLAGGDGAALLALLSKVKEKAEQQLGKPLRLMTIQEAGRDGFWIHRLLEAAGIQSHVVDPASIAVSRRHRRAKTDALDLEVLMRTLLAWRRGERRVCAMVRVPCVEHEDVRRGSRERERLVKERTQHVNRIKALLATQGILDFQPTHKEARQRLEDVITGDGRVLPPRLKAELLRELDRLELVARQLAEIERERDAAVTASNAAGDKAGLLVRLKGIGPQGATVLLQEAFHRQFSNRREIAAYAGLVPSPWQSGGTDHEQGISKSGNARLRGTMMELAWLWVRHQPGSALSAWFREHVGDAKGRRRRIAIVAVARKLLVALWRYVEHGVVPKGAELKAA
jgi:transposase